MKRSRAILLAAEYAGAPQLRCTSLGDAVHQLAEALAGEGWAVTVVTPGYGFFESPKAASGRETLSVHFAGEDHEVGVFSPGTTGKGVQHVVAEHARFSPHGPGHVYCHDEPDTPFATDATKFAFFSACAAAYVAAQPEPPQVVHAFDWQTALYFAVRAFDPQYRGLTAIRSVFSIHSLSVQGRRPLGLDDSSLRSWFGRLSIPRRAVVDPLYGDCINPVATALRLADATCIASARLAKDARASGGEGLHSVFARCQEDGRLVVIADGGTPRGNPVRRPAWHKVRHALEIANRSWIASQPALRSAHYLADRDIAALGKTKPRVLVTLLGPFHDSQTGLLRTPLGRAPSALDALLDTMGGGERVIALGDSSPQSDTFLRAVAARQPRFVYLAGHERALATLLLSACDFHLLVPESAANAARAIAALNVGRPCLVHDTGALHDVVTHEKNGWRVGGGTASFGRRLVTAFANACAVKRAGGDGYTRLTRAAARTGPSWPDVARKHIKSLYRGVAV